jgi:hypothetical protein
MRPKPMYKYGGLFATVSLVAGVYIAKTIFLKWTEPVVMIITCDDANGQHDSRIAEQMSAYCLVHRAAR